MSITKFQKCEYCEEEKQCTQTNNGKVYMLCDECSDQYYEGGNSSGYCSLDCIMGKGCDGSC